MRTAILYHYFEKDDSYRDNLDFFLQVGTRIDADFLFIISGECSLALPSADNYKYLRVPNGNLDYGGYRLALNFIDLTRYDAVFFLNSTLRGPFIPSWFGGSWTDIFLSQLKDPFALVGITQNFLTPDSQAFSLAQEAFGYTESLHHVQSFGFVISAKVLEQVMQTGFFGIETHMSKTRVIVEFELGLSVAVRNLGYGITSIVNPTLHSDDISPYENAFAKSGDTFYDKAYFGRTLHPFETVFTKTNRNLLPARELANLTIMSLNQTKAAGGLLDRSTEELKGLLSSYAERLKMRQRIWAYTPRPLRALYQLLISWVRRV